jgi:hypothetical protein
MLARPGVVLDDRAPPRRSRRPGASGDHPRTKHIDDPERGRVRAQREPRDGAVLLFGESDGVGEERADLIRAADTTFDGRSRGQVMADTLVERVTGRPSDVAEPVAVNLVLSDETLLAGHNWPAVVEGYGPIPAAVAPAHQRSKSANSSPGSASPSRSSMLPSRTCRRWRRPA